MALKGLGRHEDALISLFYCAAMERTLLNDVRDEMAKVWNSNEFRLFLLVIPSLNLYRS